MKNGCLYGNAIFKSFSLLKFLTLRKINIGERKNKIIFAIRNEELES